MIHYQILDEHDDHGFQLIELKSDPYTGIRLTFGGVKFTEENDSLKLKFTYDIKSDYNIQSKNDLEQHLGDVLMDIIKKENDITYYGGL